MGRAVHIAGAAIMALLLCSGAWAQARGGISLRPVSGGAAPIRVMPRTRAAIPSAVPPTSGTRVVRGASITRIAPEGGVVSSSSRSFGGSVNIGDEIGVPGLGFDYPHLAAISRGFNSNRFGSFNRGGHRNQNLILPIFYGGFPYYDYVDPSLVQQPQPETQSQPQIIVVQPVIQQSSPAPQQSYTAPVTPAAPEATPVSDVSGFVLVRGDGRLLFASAFSVIGTQLHYVTPEGIRRILPVADLDAAATQEMNEARGITVQLQN